MMSAPAAANAARPRASIASRASSPTASTCGCAAAARATKAESEDVPTVPEINESAPLPAGLLVRADARAITRRFLALAPLQPVLHTREGLVCAPRAAPEAAARALARCPLPLEELRSVPGWPSPPSDAIAGWYRRGPSHAPAPVGIGELILPPGEGFGSESHPTTAMCLYLMRHLPDGPALDAGCGSGLLAQAWARAGRGPAIGYDLDPRALSQARKGAALAGLAEQVTFHRGPLEGLSPDDLNGRIVLANIPAPAHHALLAGADETVRACALSGLRANEVAPVVDAWTRRGLRIVRAGFAGGFCAIALRRR
jgi:hypothetical protein